MKRIKTELLTELTTTKEGNALIMRKGKTSLFSAKIMLFALLKIENRTGKKYSIEETRYYRQLYFNSKVDYTKGLVSEIDVSELRSVLGKEKSGSFYPTLRELFSIDPRDEKSLRNSWAVMLPNNDSGVLGYAEVITSCHYDTAHGKLFLKFSDEEFIKSQLWQIRSEYTTLPTLFMFSLKSIHSYRLYEILYSEVMKADNALKAKGETVLPTEYSFRYTLGELQLMMGAVDITKDRQGMKQIASVADPDYNSIILDVNSRQRENMGEYRSFRRYSLDVAQNEINSKENSAFTIHYEIEKEERGRRVAYIIFYVKKRVVDQVPKQQEPIQKNEENCATVIVNIAKELSSLSLSFDEINKIAVAAAYDESLVIAAYDLYRKMAISEYFVDWFIELRK